MRISEIYRSDQGEGLLTGTPSIFVRTSGCNLRCDFCDTPFASWEPEGPVLSVDEIMQQVLQLADADTAVKHVVLTGGEPMLPIESIPLCQMLKQHPFHVTIETAGTVKREIACDLMSISPKMSNSTPAASRAGQWREKHEHARRRPDVVAALIQHSDYQIKFVVKTPNDLPEILEFLKEVPAIENEKVLLMPEGVTTDNLQEKADWLEQICESHGFKLCQRQHIFWYGNQRGT